MFGSGVPLICVCGMLFRRYGLVMVKFSNCQSQWARLARGESAAAWLLGLRVRIPLAAWMYISCESCGFVRLRSIRRAGQSSTVVLSSVVCLSVIVKPRLRGGPGPLAAISQRKKSFLIDLYTYFCTMQTLHL
jgi:hypothetical protein